MKFHWPFLLFSLAIGQGAIASPQPPGITNLSELVPDHVVGKTPVFSSTHEQRIEGRWIVFFDETRANSAKNKLAGVPGLRVRYGLQEQSDFAVITLDGKRGLASELRTLEDIASLPGVRFIEADHAGYELFGNLTGITTRSGVDWGMDRIDQTSPSLNGKFTTNKTGSGVHIYVVDSGVYSTHMEVTGRIGNGADFVTADESDLYCGGGVAPPPNIPGDPGEWMPLYDQNEDPLFHGTGVASIAAGKTLGVAPKATVHSVRIFDCRGSTTLSTLVAGLNWIANNAQHPAVVNMSLGGPTTSSSLVSKINELYSAGVVMVAAAGNSNIDACNVYPAAYTKVIAVGATGSNNRLASFSNHGTCVDILAPGDNIRVASGNGSATKIVDGTSFSAPFVAGVVAQFLEANPSMGPHDVRLALIANATSGVDKRGKRVTDDLLYTKYYSPAADVSMTRSCVGSSTRHTFSWNAVSGAVRYVLDYAVFEPGGLSNPTPIDPGAEIWFNLYDGSARQYTKDWGTGRFDWGATLRLRACFDNGCAQYTAKNVRLMSCALVQPPPGGWD